MKNENTLLIVLIVIIVLLLIRAITNKGKLWGEEYYRDVTIVNNRHVIPRPTPPPPTPPPPPPRHTRSRP